jgi:CBS domain containing-hemolysin-like protein
VIILIIVVFTTLFISANCSFFEAVLYSTRMGTLEAAKAKFKGRGQRLATRMIGMKKDVAEPIAAILILNTVANTAGATLAGMYATNVLGIALVPFFSIVFTLSILFFSEILPKTVGVVYWRNFWQMIVYPVTILKYLLYPVLYITQKFSNLITKNRPVTTVTEDEILALVRLGAHEGEISQEESQIVKNIINLENKRVREIMTPRTMILSLDANLTIDQAFQKIKDVGLSRIPIFDEHKEKIIGYVMAQDINSAIASAETESLLKAKARPISFVPGTANCLTLLLRFLKSRIHIAIVFDEYGGVDGLITLEDLIETVLGAEIVDETDRIVDLQDAARKRRKKEE